MPNIPSYFTRAGRDSYYGIRFLRDFVEDLQKPVSLDGSEHIDYVPTQVVTEYLRWMLISVATTHGILFRSAQTGRQNCVLFTESEGCINEGDDPAKAVLMIDKSSIHAVRVVSKPEPLT